MDLFPEEPIDRRLPKTYKLKLSFIKMVREMSEKSGEDQADILETAISYYYVNSFQAR